LTIRQGIEQSSPKQAGGAVGTQRCCPGIPLKPPPLGPRYCLGAAWSVRLR